MAIHPIETQRYGRKEVKNIFEEEEKLQKILDCEAALSRAHAKVGNIPRKAASEITRKALTKYVKNSRIKKIEGKIHHDVMAIVKALSEQCKSHNAGKYVHLGATSNDITDTALALQLKDFYKILESDLKKFKDILLKQAKKQKKLVCIGRTHGQHAVPLTYGLKFALWACEMERHIDRAKEVKKRILVGQLTGAVGTQAALGKKGQKIQEIMMKELGLSPVIVSNQIIQRDRHAEFLLLLALASETLNKIATEIRNLQRTEISEVSEGFRKNQVGSSTMPHKKNPIYAERICGLSRIIKADAFAQMENIPLWHERDLTNSSPERIIIPEACILFDYIINLSIDLIDNLVFNKKAIKRNLELSNGTIMAERLMVELTNKGMGRQVAHELIKNLAMKSYDKNVYFGNILKRDKKVKDFFSDDEIDELLKPENYIGTSEEQVGKVLRMLK